MFLENHSFEMWLNVCSKLLAHGCTKSWIKIPLASNLLVVFIEAQSSKQAFPAIDLRKPLDNFCT
jgi:hypothetical protein